MNNDNITDEGYCRLAVAADHDDIYSILEERNEWLIAIGEPPFDPEYVIDCIDYYIPKGTVVVCEINNEVCGVCTFRNIGKFLYMNNALTKLSHHGKGLLLKLEKFLVETYHKSLRFDVILPNDKLVQYHISLGAVPVRKRKERNGTRKQILNYDNPLTGFTFPT